MTLLLVHSLLLMECFGLSLFWMCGLNLKNGSKNNEGFVMLRFKYSVIDLAELGFSGEALNLFLASKAVSVEVSEFLSRELLDSYDVFKHVFRWHFCDKSNGRSSGGFSCDSVRCVVSE